MSTSNKNRGPRGSEPSAFLQPKIATGLPCRSCGAAYRGYAGAHGPFVEVTPRTTGLHPVPWPQPRHLGEAGNIRERAVQLLVHRRGLQGVGTAHPPDSQAVYLMMNTYYGAKGTLNARGLA